MRNGLYILPSRPQVPAHHHSPPFWIFLLLYSACAQHECRFLLVHVAKIRGSAGTGNLHVWGTSGIHVVNILNIPQFSHCLK